MSSNIESLKISAEMFDKLKYDEIEFSPNNKDNNYKSDNSMQEWKIILKNVTNQDIFDKIHDNLDLLSQIESEEMCIPLYLAKNYIKKSILPLKINSDDFKLPFKNILAIWETNIADLLEQLFLFVHFEIENFSLFVDPSREKFFAKLLFDILGMIKETTVVVNKKEIMYLESLENNFKSVLVFKASDINAAVDQIVNSFEDPYSKTGIRSIYVQESCYDNFSNILSEKLRCYPADVLKDKYFCKTFPEYLQIIDKMNAKTIKPKLKNDEKIVPTICLNFARQYYDRSGHNIFAPIVNLQSFRTVKDAMSLMTEDQNGTISIWVDNYAIAYEISIKSNFTFFEINCHDISQYPLYRVKNYVFLNTFEMESKSKLEIPRSGVVIDGNYHYQFFEEKSGSFKVIISPIGVTFAN